VTIAKGAVAPRFNVEAPPAPPPAEVNVTTAPVNVASPEVRISKGAFNVEAPPPANVTFDKGAIEVDASTNVEPPPPTEVNVQPPNVNVEVRGGKSTRTVEFSDGTSAKIDDETSTKRTVEFSDGRSATIREEEE
jgi:phage baseplate assembly protein gpV